VGAVERTAGLPPKLLAAITLVESGRLDPVRGVVEPWPWTINVAGTGYFYPSKADAIAAVQAFQAAGVQSIDVGCMQVNLMHHPDAFGSLDAAFDPTTNTVFAASFLRDLHRELGGWPQAVAAYHSRTPDLAADYEQRVAKAWPLAAAYGVPALPPPLEDRPAKPRVDPYRIYTPQFAAQIAAQSAARMARLAAMRGYPARGQDGARQRRVAVAMRESAARP
jgi:hypothetical protein